MPCPHNEITIVQRSQQQSAVAAAAGELTLPAATCTFIVASLKTSFAKVRVYASLSHLSRGEMSKDGTQQVPPFELSPLRVNVARGQ